VFLSFIKAVFVLPAAVPCLLQDDAPDEWVAEAMLAPDLLEDWAAGLERAPVTALLDVQQWGTSREYLVQWADGSKVCGDRGGAAGVGV
jgi:hypothetical protein